MVDRRRMVDWTGIVTESGRHRERVLQRWPKVAQFCIRTTWSWRGEVVEGGLGLSHRKPGPTSRPKPRLKQEWRLLVAATPG